jgi:hypothetical protein
MIFRLFRILLLPPTPQTTVDCGATAQIPTEDFVSFASFVIFVMNPSDG